MDVEEEKKAAGADDVEHHPRSSRSKAHHHHHHDESGWTDPHSSSSREHKEKMKKHKKKHKPEHSSKMEGSSSTYMSLESSGKATMDTETSPFSASLGSIDEDTGQSAPHNRKSKRTTTALLPGAVSVEPVEPQEPFHASFEGISQAPRQHHGKAKRAVATVTPGAVSVKPGEQEEPFHSSFPGSGPSQQPSSFHALPGTMNVPASRQDGKSKRTVKATVPGAVAVRGDEPEPFHASSGSVGEKPIASNQYEMSRAIEDETWPFPASTCSDSDKAAQSSQYGKSKRTVKATMPGAVSMKGDEPDPFHASAGSMNEKPSTSHEPPSFHASTGAIHASGSQQHGKTKRRTAALVPGVVSMKGEVPEAVSVPKIPISEKLSASRQHGKSKRTTAIVPGAVAAKGEAEPESFHTSTGSTNETPSTYHEPPSFHASTGAINASTSRQHGKSKRMVPAVLPGAVQTKGEEPEPFHSSTGSMTEDSSPSRQYGKSKRLVAAAEPGAAQIKGNEPEYFHTSFDSVNMYASTGSVREGASSSSQFGKSKRETATFTPGAVSMTQPVSMFDDVEYGWERWYDQPTEESERPSHASKDKDAKSRGERGRKMGTVTAGAIAMDGDDDAISPFGKSGRMVPIADSQDSDAVAIYGGRCSRGAMDEPVPATSKPGAESFLGPEAQTAHDVMRRKDPRASAQERSFLVTNAAAVTAGTIGIAAVTEEDIEESNEEYRKRVDAKIDQLEMEMNPAALDRILSAEKDDEPNPADDYSDSDFADKSDSFGIDESDKEQPTEETGSPQTEALTARGLTRTPEAEYGELPRNDDDGLAVAIAIDEEDEPMLPAAIEYDPNAKPPIYRNRRFRLYAITGAIIVIAVIVGVVVGFVAREDQSLQGPTAAPTTMLEANYREQFVSAVGEQVNEAGSPYDRAAEWIMFQDPLRLQPDADNLIQRYQLVLFYFLTTNNGQRRWNSCSPPLQNEDDTCVFQDLQFTGDVVESQIYENVTGKIRWMAGTHECEWNGAFCDPGENLIALELCKCQHPDSLLFHCTISVFCRFITRSFLTGAALIV